MVTDQLNVSQRARDAACDYMAEVSAMQGKYDPVAMAFMDEACDELPIVQAFARFEQDTADRLREAGDAWRAFKSAFLEARGAWPPCGIDAMQQLNRLLPNSCGPALNRSTTDGK